MRELRALVYIPLALASLLVLLNTGHKLSVFILAPLFVWLHFGIYYISKEFPRAKLKSKYFCVWGWGFIYLYKELMHFEDAARYNVILNDVNIGEITAGEYKEIKLAEYLKATNVFDQINAALSAIIVSIQILIAYTGGVIVWAMVVSFYIDKSRAISWIEENYRALDANKIELFLGVAAIAIAVISIRIVRNVYKENINTKLRIKFKVPALGDVILEKI